MADTMSSNPRKEVEPCGSAASAGKEDKACKKEVKATSEKTETEEIPIDPDTGFRIESYFAPEVGLTLHKLRKADVQTQEEAPGQVGKEESRAG